MMPLLVLMGDAVGMYGGYLVAVQLLGANPVIYVDNSFQYLPIEDDIISGLIKAAVFGLIFSPDRLRARLRHEGRRRGRRAARRRGRSSREASRSSSTDFFLTKLLF